jgi:phosphatidylserine/phosphatidylglycerophosphate/cardiolipin synthase-like enzyme
MELLPVCYKILQKNGKAIIFLKHAKTLAFIGLTCLTAFAQFPYQNFEIVESIPLETRLDNPEIRNTAEVWLEMIGAAKNTIDIEQFYISNQVGEALEPIIQAIEAAADRDVKIRIIAENRMSKTYPDTFTEPGKY